MFKVILQNLEQKTAKTKIKRKIVKKKKGKA